MGNRKMDVPVIFGMTRYELVLQIVGDVSMSVCLTLDSSYLEGDACACHILEGKPCSSLHA